MGAEEDEDEQPPTGKWGKHAPHHCDCGTEIPPWAYWCSRCAPDDDD